MEKKNIKCPLCLETVSELIFEWGNVPANIGILWKSKDAALNCSKGDLKIAFCGNCGYIWNTVFDPNQLEYSQAYDNTLHYSAVYCEYAKKMALHLIERYQIRSKTVLEIGCGKGDFLILLSSLGDNRAVGFDTSFEARDLQPEAVKRITIVRDFYNEKYATYSGDLIVSRYVLEHIENPLKFIQMVRKNIGGKKETVVYFEVPDVYLILDQLSIWDFIYEHVSYFSPSSLAYTFQAAGFDVLNLSETYNGQFITIEAAPGNGDRTIRYDIQKDLVRLKRNISEFQSQLNDKFQNWRNTVDKIKSEKKRTLIWGAGAKGVSYLNMLNIRDELPYIVDINPNKHGKYVAGTGQKIVPPEFAAEYRPEQVIVMNPIYQEEIRTKLNEMGVDAKLIVA